MWPFMSGIFQLVWWFWGHPCCGMFGVLPFFIPESVLTFNIGSIYVTEKRWWGRQEMGSTSPNVSPDKPDSTELPKAQLPTGKSPRLCPLALFPGCREEMFTSLFLMIMPLNGWKIAQVGGSNSDSSRLITALKCTLVRGQWCTCHWTWAYGERSEFSWGSRGMGCVSATAGGDSDRGRYVFWLSGCERKGVLGSSSAHRFGSQTRLSWPRDFGQIVKPLGTFVSSVQWSI